MHQIMLPISYLSTGTKYHLSWSSLVVTGYWSSAVGQEGYLGYLKLVHTIFEGTSRVTWHEGLPANLLRLLKPSKSRYK